ncbi:MAG: hypothetical protein ACI8WB_003094 [Phenylobacterium sp.]|jgi:hypothetical protein
MKLKIFSAVAMAAAALISAYSFASTKIYATVYYSDATYSTWVGEKEQTCHNGTISYGTSSAYSKRYYLGTCGSEI